MSTNTRLVTRLVSLYVDVLKEDAGLALIFDKTKILVKGISAADAHAAAQLMLNADPSLAHLRPLLSPASFVVDGYIGLGVPIGTDAFIQHFVQDKCLAIMEDVTSSRHVAHARMSRLEVP
jgi:hypothetical protein